ncbi:MAG: rhodanese-like domain-containing protein [Saprospiraceae bacterium]|nr:rhodanese-like domain-containing protein [Saprospiraceae bacterium]
MIDIFKNGKVSVVDVRTPAEFMGGHVVGSVNIPLNEIPNRMEELRSLKSPVVLCCASGGRSAQATGFLAMKGLDCIDGGSWTTVNFYQSQAAPGASKEF